MPPFTGAAALFGCMFLCQFLLFDMHINICFIHGHLEHNHRIDCLLSAGSVSVDEHVEKRLPFVPGSFVTLCKP